MFKSNTEKKVESSISFTIPASSYDSLIRSLNNFESKLSFDYSICGENMDVTIKCSQENLISLINELDNCKDVTV